MLKILKYDFKEARIAYVLELIALLVINAGIIAIALYQKSNDMKIIDINFHPGIIAVFAYLNAWIVISTYIKQLSKSIGGLYFSTEVKGISFLFSKIVEYCLAQGLVVLIQSLLSYIFKMRILEVNSPITENLFINAMRSVTMFDLIVFAITIFILLDSRVQNYGTSTILCILLLGVAGMAGLIVNYNLGELVPQTITNINLPIYSKEGFLNIFLGAFVRDGVLKINPVFLGIKFGLFVSLILSAGTVLDKKLNMSFNG